jgi:hypothetical protein
VISLDQLLVRTVIIEAHAMRPQQITMLFVVVQHQTHHGNSSKSNKRYISQLVVQIRYLGSTKKAGLTIELVYLSGVGQAPVRQKKLSCGQLRIGKKKVYPRFELGLLEDFDDKSKSRVITTTCWIIN